MHNGIRELSPTSNTESQREFVSTTDPTIRRAALFPVCEGAAPAARDLPDQPFRIEVHAYSPVYFLLFVPIVLFVMMIPISIGGLGVREGTLALLFSAVGVAPVYSVPAGLLWHALQIAALLPGLLLFTFRRKRSPPGDAASESRPQPQVDHETNQSV